MSIVDGFDPDRPDPIVLNSLSLPQISRLSFMFAGVGDGGPLVLTGSQVTQIVQAAMYWDLLLDYTNLTHNLVRTNKKLSECILHSSIFTQPRYVVIYAY